MLKHLSILCLINLLNYVNIKHNYHFIYIGRQTKYTENITDLFTVRYLKYTAIQTEVDSVTFVMISIDCIGRQRSTDHIIETNIAHCCKR